MYNNTFICNGKKFTWLRLRNNTQTYTCTYLQTSNINKFTNTFTFKHTHLYRNCFIHRYVFYFFIAY